MPAAAVEVLTARTLLDRVHPSGPVVEGEELAFRSDPPADLVPALAVLHTGVRALLAGHAWWATVENGRAGRFTRLRVVELDPAAPLPPGTSLLCVAGDGRWDRIAPAVREDRPELFAGGLSVPKRRRS